MRDDIKGTWEEVIQRNEQMDRIITTVKRSDDWMAHIAGNKSMWASGRTESEAIGELWRTWFEEIVKKCKEL